MNRFHPPPPLPRRRRRRSATRGFTLLELMVSVGILAVVLSAAFAFLLSFDKATKYNVHYYELYQDVQDDQIKLDELLTSAYSVWVSTGADQINGDTRTITFDTISGFASDGVTPIAAAQTLTWTKTGVVNEAKFGFDCDGDGVIDNHNVGTLALNGVAIGDTGDVIEPIVTFNESTCLITITLERINSEGYVAKRTMEAYFNPSSELIQ
ncbi:MAG: PulJ/GspJ family protein [Planctomycetota bacterium]